MARAIYAFVAFNVYSLFLIAAFQKNTPFLFDAALMAEMHAGSESFDIQAWGWKDHYLWRLVAAIVATAVTAFLAGAIAQRNGARVALAANVPSVIMWAIVFYLMAFGEDKWEGQTGFAIVAAIAIPLTTWIAYRCGKIGEETQANEFRSETVLGIRPYHWIWIVLPLYLFSLGIIFVVTKFLAVQFLTIRDFSLMGAFIGLLALVPVIAWLAPLVFAYNVLAGNALTERSPGMKGLTNVGVISGGFLLATGIQFGCFWALQKLTTWWYS